jgi:glycosyltransferase involved in cell wall biosynthesis
MVVLFERFIKCPVITTVHGPLREVYERETYLKSPKSHYVSISNSQRQLLPDINWIGTIHHGIDVNKFGFNEKPQDYFVFLGRISPEKGIAEICRMIKQTDYKLKIAAIIDPVDRMYFEAEVNPLIDGEQIEFLGEIDHAQKNTLLGGARALLLWANWEEPFGLPVIESMACGTPVIVNPRGSMPELIVDGKTGIFVHTVDEMKEQLQNIGVIDRAACRAHVTEHFSKERMVDEYLSLANGLYNE